MVATGLLGCFTFPFVLAGIAVAINVAAGDTPSVWLVLPLHAAALILSLWGLWRGAVWGWFLAVIFLGMFSLGAFMGAVRWLLEGGDSLSGALLWGIVAFLGAAPLALLIKARARYQAWAICRAGASGSESEPPSGSEDRGPDTGP